MTKIRPVLFTSKEYKNGEHPVMIRVGRMGKSIYFSINNDGITALPKQWNQEYGLLVKDKRLNPDYEYLNSEISKRLVEIKDEVERFEKEGSNWTLNKLKETVNKKVRTRSVKDYFDDYISNLNDSNRFRAAKISERTVFLLESFDRKFKMLQFSDIDYNYIIKFHNYLRFKRGNNDTSIGMVFRDLRAVLNSAIKDGVGSKLTYPFKSNSKDQKAFQISRLSKKKTKKSIPKDLMVKMNKEEFEEPHLELTRNLFLFSFYANGMNFSDMAFLKKDCVKSRINKEGEEIQFFEFIRSKTKEPIEVLVGDKLKKIIKILKSYKNKKSPYLLPIITVLKYKGSDLIKHVDYRRKRYNKNLKTLAKKLGYPDSLSDISSYFSRHTYANIMLQGGASTEIIQEALGHTDLKTTQHYLNSFGSDVIGKHNEKLLD